eukprot:TRINITY_DN7993_c0_g1_i1.p1 TRINITY_DN7993_c0_g1~~TRINITY_DN7993_c0_g1_i1.p1  ORF type:complete len:233 (+),score=52.47 TRINITY_DN7993_c0_g1_i1:89-787(+)
MARVVDKLLHPRGIRDSDFERDDRGQRFSRQNRWDRDYDEALHGGRAYDRTYYGPQYGRPYDRNYVERPVDTRRGYALDKEPRAVIYRDGPEYVTYERDVAYPEDRYYDSRDSRVVESSSTGFQPIIDLSETETQWHVHAELPGVDKSHIHVTCEDGRLTISGERARSTVDGGRTYHRSERSYGKFSRTFTLPAHVDTKDIKAEFLNGVLEVSVPKPAEYNQRQLNKRVNIV